MTDITFIDRNNEIHTGRQIDGYENYLVLKDGRIWSRKTKRFLKTWDNGCGYDLITLSKKNTKQKFRVHRLVAEAYIPNPEELETVDHIDGNKHNNDVSNLQWLTRGDNIRKSRSKIVYQFSLGGNLIKVFPSTVEAERQTGVANSNISKCANGKTKTAGGYIWKYDERGNENG